MNKTYNIVFITITILSVIIASTAIMSEAFAFNPASKKLNDWANDLEKEAEQAQKDGNDAKAFAKSLTAKKLREKA